MARKTPRVDGAILIDHTDAAQAIRVGTSAWYAWLDGATTFAFADASGRFTARKERRGDSNAYWKAYRKRAGVVRSAYLGKTPDLTWERLQSAAATLAEPTMLAGVEPRLDAPLATLIAEPIALDLPVNFPPLHPPNPQPPRLPPAGMPLLTTKLYIPALRPQLVPRPHLLERMQAGLLGKLTLIVAPAGFGKTTVISVWVALLATSDVRLEAHEAIPRDHIKAHVAYPYAARIAWLSLDAADNDPTRFWRYVIAAIETVRPGVGESACIALAAPQPPPIETILTVLINALAAGLPEPSLVVLVLDDYHVISTPAIHDALTFLLDHLPPQLRLILTSRVDPPLALARLRARSALTELRATDLRFTPDEVATFLNQVMGLSLAADDLAALEARSEGWIVGLQLAALAMRDRRDRTSFIRTFTGSNRYIVEYLAAEVFASQPTHIQTFLLRTAILDRMCGSLCDAVLRVGDWEIGDQGAAMQTTFQLPTSNLNSYSQLILAQLERANLFVVPLDDDGQWYRYHHLFAEALRHRLVSGVPPETIASLHRHASEWYARHGFIAEAVQHALTATDGERAIDLIEQHGLRIIVSGQVQTVLGWLNALPDALLRTRPMLCVLHALTLLFTNDLVAAETRIQDAERYIQPDTPSAEARLIQGNTAAIRANIARYTGDLAGCVAFAQQVLGVLPETETIARTIARLHVARAFRVSGDVTDEAERRAMTVLAPFHAADNLLGALAAITNLARLQVLQGQLHAAAATYREMTQIASRPGAPLLLEGPAYYIGMGALLYEWNDLAAAEQHVAQAMEQLAGRLAVDAEDVALGYIALARLQYARGECAIAQLTLETYTGLARRRGFVAHLVVRGAALQAQLALAQGNRAAAVAWADASCLDEADDLSFSREAEYLILARVWIAQASSGSDGVFLQQALQLLECLLEDATAKARLGSVLEILIVRALAQWAQGTHGDALATIERALTLAAPEGYIRRFVDEGPTMATLLVQSVKRKAQNDAIRSYTELLLAAFPEEQLGARNGQNNEQLLLRSALERSSALVEPLSARELEVLRLIASGKSNAEVARTLVIALSTVKTHTNSIFAKLRVTSRTQAIALSRDLQLL